MGQCLECGWHGGEHRGDCNKYKCKFCGKASTDQHHDHCPTKAGPGEMKVWERGFEHGRLGKPRDGYGPHYNLGYQRGRVKLDEAVAAIPPGWS